MSKHTYVPEIVVPAIEVWLEIIRQDLDSQETIFLANQRQSQQKGGQNQQVAPPDSGVTF